jgi:hypothetical protein
MSLDAVFVPGLSQQFDSTGCYEGQADWCHKSSEKPLT